MGSIAKNEKGRNYVEGTDLGIGSPHNPQLFGTKKWKIVQLNF